MGRIGSTFMSSLHSLVSLCFDVNINEHTGLVRTLTISHKNQQPAVNENHSVQLNSTSIMQHLFQTRCSPDTETKNPQASFSDKK